MYELDDPGFESLLTDATRRGVAVRVLLDRDFEGGRVNHGAYARMVAAGVPVRWAPPSVLFHQKTITVDSSVSAIMTGNLVADEVRTSRDFVVLDHQRSAVAAIESVFEKDWDGDPVVAEGDPGGLVWSPGAEDALLALIGSARDDLLVENEEMDSYVIESALVAAARRGVRVRVVMTADPRWNDALGRLAQAGVQVGTVPDGGGNLYLHAKVVVADGKTAFVGSQISRRRAWSATVSSASSPRIRLWSVPWPPP